MVQSSVLAAANFAELFRTCSNAEPNVFESQSHPLASNASHRLPAHPPCLPSPPTAFQHIISPLATTTQRYSTSIYVTTTIMSSIPTHNAVALLSVYDKN